MKNKSACLSGFFNLRVTIALLVCMAAVCSLVTGTVPAFLRPQGQGNASQRTLTLEERVSYQRAIEDVYWRHRIWPKERPDPKPSLDAVMSHAQLEKKVADYLRNSQALEDYWQRPITAEQLQAEMERMATHTRQPEVLRELFEALGNDPFVIAECLARRALAERLITNWYAYDQRIHGELRQRVEADLQAHPTVEQMKQLNGEYTEIELIKRDRTEDEQHQSADRGVKLNSREWDETVQRLATICGESTVEAGVSPASGHTGARSPATRATLGQIKTGVVSPLQEDESHYYATAVVEKTNDRLKLATVEWLKESLESWRVRTENHPPAAIALATTGYTLPAIATGGCTDDDTWTATDGPPLGRESHTAVWTGSEMIVWGGYTFISGSGYLNTGGRYNPGIDSWTATTTMNAPAGRSGHTAVWTGSEMIVWGGNFVDNTGGRYNPGTDSWTATTTVDAPTARSGHTAVWTGSEMIVWGGVDDSGGRYNPNTDSWTSTNTTNAPAGRSYHTAVWTGSEMIIWGGVDDSGFAVNTGGKYNPGTNSWTATTTINAPSGREFHTAVWSGSEMIVWGGYDESFNYPTIGGRYNPSTNVWTTTTTNNAPTGRKHHTTLWTGGAMIVWGGDDSSSLLNTGGRYNPITNSWTATSTAGAPVARNGHTTVWSGTEMIVWGGNIGPYPYYSNTGVRYNSTTDTWTPSSTPGERKYHTAVWTGSEMIVWGGYAGGDNFLDTGGKYVPSTDDWTPTSTTNAPTGRELPTAVWTGSEMIVWGGYSYDGVDHYWNTGGRYNPGTDGWVATSTTNAPVGRESQQAVWTGNEMIVWGGYYYDGNDHYLNTGGRYNPSTNSWAATGTTNAPSARASHKAVWTGLEMIVWGGGDGVNYLNTGGKYNTGTNNWMPMSNTGAPSARTSHTATWSGSEMIVWGGYFFDISGDHYLETGGRYNPITNSWTPTSITNVPDGRALHTAVWTGSEMIVWGGLASEDTPYFDSGGRYDPGTDSWTATSTTNAPSGRYRHTAVWTDREMIVWAGVLYTNTITNTGGRYCAQSGPTPTPSPTPTPTPCTGRCEPTPRPRPTPHVRPTPR